MKSAKLGIALLLCVGLLASLGTASASAQYGISGFSNSYQDALSGEPLLQAGSHPDLITDLTLDTHLGPLGETIPDGQIKDVITELPPGFYGNPQVIPTCNAAELVAGDGYCNPAAQVGTFAYEIAPNFLVDFPIYNMEVPAPQTAVLGAIVVGAQVKFEITARTDGDFGLTAKIANANQALKIRRTVVTLWGVPAAEIHDPDRCTGLFLNCGTPAGIEPKPFLTLPARCEPVTTTLFTDSWQEPGRRNPDGTFDLSERHWASASETTPPLEGCDELDFRPSLKARPTSNTADSPSGLEADLAVPQNVDDPDQRSSAMVKTVTTKLPKGITINPSAANGLGACSPTQIGLTTAVGAAEPHFTKNPANCPDDASIGSVEVQTQVFPDLLKGKVFTMTPYDNPFGTLLGVYVVIEGHGLVIKQAGKVQADPVTGQLTATFSQVPQLPFEHFKLKFDAGSTAVLKTPAACGQYATTSDIDAWSSPETPAVSSKDEYAISAALTGGGCASNEGSRPNTPSFQAGTVSAIGGDYSPFVFKLSRNDGTQQLTGIDTVLPKGLLAKLAGTTYCPDAALAAAAKKDGKAEQASPSCPASSRVGSVTVGAGAGPKPFYAPATAYLAGPYKGAPLSLAVVAPAVAGPFDLGTVVVRNALYVDTTTAQVHAVSDPFPTILQGIPLDLRSVDLRLDRDEFTKNPTSCDPFQITGFASSPAGQQAALNNRFQVGECGRLGFKPSLNIKLKGEAKRSGNPAVTAVVKYPKGGSYANIKKTTVVLPKTEFIDNAHISNPCTRVQFDAKECPKGSILGTARAFSPLLDRPLEGPVYFRSNGGDRELPDMVVDLDGQIHVTLVGFIDSVRVKGAESSRVRTRFLSVPDAPVSKFVLKLYGGKRGLIENSVNLCRARVGPASVQMEAQNADTAFFDQPLGTSCGGKKKGKR